MKTCIVLLTIFSLVLSAEISSSKRDKRLISLFSVIQFPNSECVVNSDATLRGTCMTSTECSDKSGKKDGNCASGFGSCCLFKKETCGSNVNENGTYVLNPLFPAMYTTAGSCAYTVKAMSTDICQIRLDFINFDITEDETSGTATFGSCTDTFTMVGPSGRNPPILCGTLTGQHVYIDQARSTSDTSLTFNIATGGTWKFKVSQIECGNPSLAMPGCDQWFMGSSGTIMSYNYPKTVLSNTRTVTCIRRNEGSCMVEYTADNPTTNPMAFALSLVATGTLNAGIATNEHAFINFPGSFESYSGQIFTNTNDDTVPGAVVTNAFSFVTEVFNDPAAANIVNRVGTGFKLNYHQVPCN